MPIACRMLNPPKVISETPSSLFFLHTVMACGTNSAALPSKPNPKAHATISFIESPPTAPLENLWPHTQCPLLQCSVRAPATTRNTMCDTSVACIPRAAVYDAPRMAMSSKLGELLLNAQEWGLGRLSRLSGQQGPRHLRTGMEGEQAALFWLRRSSIVVVARRWTSARLR